MRWYMRPEDQGQMIEVSYAYDGAGNAYRRTHDRSDGSISYEVGELDWECEPIGEPSPDHEPQVIAWFVCGEVK